MSNEIKTDEILEMFTEETEKEKKPKSFSKKGKKKKRAHPWAFPLGLAITVLSVIGLVTVIIAGVGTAKKALIKVKNVDEYNKMLIPVVMNDPDTFDDLSKADMSQLLDISIWAILKNDLSPDTYSYNDSGMVIPEKDVAKQFKELFGDKINPVHATVTGFGYEFTYDAASKCYTIPLTGVAPVYTPDVINIEKKSNTIVLTVAYLAANGWAQDSNGKMVAPAPDKYMKITLRESDSGYYISAIQATSTPETAVTAAITVIADEIQSSTLPFEDDNPATSTTEASTTQADSETTTEENTSAVQEDESTTASSDETTTAHQTSIQ